MGSSDPLDALLHVSQDFPKYSAAIARRVEVPEPIQRKMDGVIRRGLSEPAMYINGKPVSEDINAFS